MMKDMYAIYCSFDSGETWNLACTEDGYDNAVIAYNEIARMFEMYFDNAILKVRRIEEGD
ncbi:MAG: hypothetical protein IJJ44_12590 [Solobacterium sp.]|nr:hypothetical protein [Solobacterium sp.]